MIIRKNNTFIDFRNVNEEVSSNKLKKNNNLK